VTVQRRNEPLQIERDGMERGQACQSVKLEMRNGWVFGLVEPKRCGTGGKVWVLVGNGERWVGEIRSSEKRM